MPKFDDITGKRFNRWTVLYRTEDYTTKSGNKFTQYMCMCDCGEIRKVFANSLKNGKSKSCGCYASEVSAKVCKENFKTHDKTKTRLYQIYHGMIKRCYNPNASNYKNYGERGVTVCDEWLDSWETFESWANENGYSDSLSIDRIDVDSGYSPSNCRWVDRVAQANNRTTNVYITYNNETHTIAEWSRIVDIPYKRLQKAIKSGKTLDSIINN